MEKNHQTLMTLLIIAASLQLSPAAGGASEPVSSPSIKDAVVAVVEGKPVLRSDLDRLQQALKRQGEDSTELAGVLERRIEDLLIASKADSLGVQISNKQVDETVQNIASQNQMTPQQLYEAIVNQGLSVTEYRKMLHDQVLRMQIVQREIEPLITIDDADLLAYMKSHPEQYALSPKVKLKLFTTQGEQTETEARHGLEQLTATEVDWQDLDVKIQQWIATTPEAFEVKAFPGSEPEKLWIQFIEVVPAGLVALEPVREQVYEQVRREKVERAFQHWLADLKSEAWIERF